MNIDFFSNSNKQSTNQQLFGICDDEFLKPSYIDESYKEKWIAVVKNSNSKNINFYPIDNVLNWNNQNGTPSKKCDGLLSDFNNLFFVELKDRRENNSRYWLARAASQLKETILKFGELYDIKKYKIQAYISNKQQRREFRQHKLKEEFNKATGIILKISRIIDV